MQGVYSKRYSCQKEFVWLRLIREYISSHDCSSSWEVIRTALAEAIGSDSDVAKAAYFVVTKLHFVPLTPANFVEVYSFDEKTQILNMERVIDSNGENVIDSNERESRTIDKYVQQEALTEEIRMEILSQLVSILTAIYHVGEPHRDLHPGNILVRQNQDESINLVVIDPNFKEGRGEKSDVDEVAQLILNHVFAYGCTRECSGPKKRRIDRPYGLSLDFSGEGSGSSNEQPPPAPITSKCLLTLK